MTFSCTLWDGLRPDLCFESMRCGMSTEFLSVRLPVVLFLGLLFLFGCEGEGKAPDVATGRFTAHVNGAVTDTLTGAGHYRMSDGALVGLELGPKNGPGLSIELEPLPPDLRTYEVVDWDLFTNDRDGPPGVMAFLTVEGAQFEATEGSLDLTYVGDDQVGASFSFEMEGEFDEGPSEWPSVHVTGALNASSER